MKKTYYFFSLAIIYAIILVDIFLVGKMVDILTVVVIALFAIISSEAEQVKRIFFLSGAGCIALAIGLYYFPTVHTFFDVAANWTYAFLLAGVVTMVVQEFKNETHK